MYFIIMGLPLAAVFAGVQFVLCAKTKSLWKKLLPVLAVLAAAGILALIYAGGAFEQWLDNIVGVYLVSLIVLLWIFIGAGTLGICAGWIIYFIKLKIS